MKANFSLLSLLVAGVLATSSQALTPRKPTVELREARIGDLQVLVRTELVLACLQQANVQVQVTNHGSEPVSLPSGGAEPGLQFLIVDSQGTLLDARGELGILSIGTLAAGQTVSSEFDLGARPLVRVEEGSQTEVARLSGLFDPALEAEPFVDLFVYQQVGDELIEFEPIRLVLHPEAMGDRDRFRALFSRPEADAGLAIWDPTHPVVPADDFVPGRVLVTFTRHADLAQAMLAVESAGYIIGSTALFDSLHMLSVLVPEGEERVAETWFRKLRVVEAASLEYVARIM